MSGGGEGRKIRVRNSKDVGHPDNAVGRLDWLVFLQLFSFLLSFGNVVISHQADVTTSFITKGVTLKLLRRLLW